MVYRLFDNETGKAIADVITLHDETIDDSKPYTIFHPVQTYKKKTLTNFTAKPLLVPIFQNGKCVYETPNIEEIKRYCSSQLELIWDEVKRFENPHEYYVDLSKSLWDVKQKLLNENF
jgi:nicotinate phosphoribosyltransferase